MKKIKEITILTFAMILATFVSGVFVTANAEAKTGEQVILEFATSLDQGARGETVRLLQSILASDPTILSDAYITGYFGSITKNAVKKFQKKYGIDQAGRVGPITRKKLNDLLARVPLEVSATSTSTATAASVPAVPVNTLASTFAAISTTCVKVPPGHLIAPGYLKKKGIVVAPACQILPPGITKKLMTPPATTTPDTIAPVISDITSTDLSTTSAKIAWKTNEYATTQVFYGATTGYASSTAQNSARVKDHTETLTGLSTGTLYHYSVRSVDEAGNAATSTDATFTTTAADMTPPVISSISATGTSATSTAVSWTTDELADSKVYYGMTTPLVTATASSTSSATLVTTHTLTLAGLTASTTHYFMVESIDLYGNKATSSEQSFTTLSL